MAVPVAVTVSAFSGVEAETLLHFLLAAGCLLLDPSAFNSPAWIRLTGVLSTGLLGITFALQGFAQVAGNATLTWLAFDKLGQWPEALLVALLMLWFVSVLFTRSSGWRKFIGYLCVVPAILLVIFGYIEPLIGAGADLFGPLKMTLLLPFVWLMLESKHPSTLKTISTGQ